MADKLLIYYISFRKNINIFELCTKKQMTKRKKRGRTSGAIFTGRVYTSVIVVYQVREGLGFREKKARPRRLNGRWKIMKGVSGDRVSTLLSTYCEF